ncbi:MAG: hypothetical protein ACI9DG_001896 [Oleispira sp.]|jgi:uncharacterized protein YbgA (DUF1722 family)/uncharacterized protein YbbK (DUF523 family)
MNPEEPHNIKIGISSCLMGENVRFDSGHKKNSYVTGILSDYFDFLPFCPEVSIGLGIPRETIRLVNVDDETRCVGTKTADLDVTEQLYQSADDQKSWHAELSGYILKKDSPTCGMERVKLYKGIEKGGMAEKIAIGLYAKRLMENFPYLPIEEEGRLSDAHLRENFIQRVYIYSRWQTMAREGFTLAGLQAFHAKHKYIFMSHNQTLGRTLGASLANSRQGIDALAFEYLASMMTLLKSNASRKNHVNTLQHIQGYLKSDLDTGDKEELRATIENYHQGLVPLIVPITLLRHHFRRHPKDYINNSFYLHPHPGQMMLLNHI